jgi:alpha-amylase/alpha-mannosidase (GH57 family)
MSKNPVCVAILWHMHQPEYGNIETGEILLPWTRFHAVKDYYDMGALVEETPGMRLTINIVPSLIDQLTAYSSGTANETYAALTAKDASQLDRFDKAFLLRHFFQLPLERMVHPYPRFADLLARRGAADPSGEFGGSTGNYSPQDYRDLQVWFNLTWCGRELRRNPEIAALFHKGRGFSEQEKRRLIEIQIAFIARILPYYRHLMERCGVELSVSPYYHPILPLLCDSRAAREALPTITLPVNPFSCAADAAGQIRRAQERFFEIFGRSPQGMWPSEGAVSNAALELIRERRLRWIATDDAVLINSLRSQGAAAGVAPAERYRAYRWGTGADGPFIFFRDHALSDLIGFTYSQWDAGAAVSDFTGRLLRIHQDLPDDGRNYVVPVILDGENAWEHYPDNGTAFLSLLYRTLTENPNLRPVSFSEYLDLEQPRDTLRSIVAGSWIYGNLATWIGHPEKNKAWDALSSARAFLTPFMREDADAPRVRDAFREMLIAEGSDWFWWYGDDHPSDNAAEFDALFRGHVRNVYRLQGQPHPQSLDSPIKKIEVRTQYRQPVHTITPRLDGRITDYYEWLAAGSAAPAGGESMHRTRRYFEKVYFGYDARFFYVRIDPAGVHQGAPASGTFHVHFASPADCLYAISRNSAGEKWECRTLRSPLLPEVAPGFGGDRILELAVPLEALGVGKPAQLQFAVAAMDGDRELERFPRGDYIAVMVDPWGLDDREWVV